MRAIYDTIKPYPRTCVWEITSRCNLRCAHCASSLGKESVRGAELSTERALKLCAELADAGCEYVALSGGEALLRKDWRRLASRLRELGVRVGMISNGLLVTDEAVGTMADVGVSVLAISVDGLASTHDTIRRREGSFAAAMSALQRGRAAGLRMHAITHVNRLNRGELGAVHDVLEGHGVCTWLVQLSAPMGRMGEQRDLVLKVSELDGFTRELAALKQRSRMYIAVGDNVGYYSELEPVLRRKWPGQPLPFWCGCTAGLLTVGIEANGNVKGCLSLQSDDYIEGNVADRPFGEVWSSEGAFAYTRKFTTDALLDGCAGCDFGEVCRGGCTFMAVAVTGRPHDNPYCLTRLLGRRS